MCFKMVCSVFWGRDTEDGVTYTPACFNSHSYVILIFTEALEECEVQTTLKIWREPLHIEFKEDSLSYMEKLWLKKHRRYFLNCY